MSQNNKIPVKLEISLAASLLVSISSLILLTNFSNSGKSFLFLRSKPYWETIFFSFICSLIFDNLHHLKISVGLPRSTSDIK